MDYTIYDYNALVQRITNLVQNAEGWGDGYKSSTGQTLIQLIAQMTDELNYMLERRTQENFLPSALLPSSVLSLASSLSYRPRRAVSPQGTLSIQLTDESQLPVAALGDVIIPRYTQLSYKNNSFVNINEVVIKKGDKNPASFQAKEGIHKSQTFSVSDTSGELYKNNTIVLTSYKNIEETSLVVYDANGSYQDVQSQIGTSPAAGALSFSGPNDKVFDIRITNDGMVILFGNGTFGKKPDHDITIEWIESSGSAVDIQSTGLAFTMASVSLTDSLNVTPPNRYYYVITNSTPITGGLDAETITQIKKLAPDYVKSANRAVIESDYEFWIKHSGIGGIIDSRVYGQQEIYKQQENLVDPLYMNNVYCVYLNENGSQLTTPEHLSLVNYLNTYKEVTTNLIFKPAEIVPLQINLLVHRNTSLSIADSEVFDVMKAELESYFTFTQGTLGAPLHYSDLVKTLHEYTITKNGKQSNVANYVNLTLRALKSVVMPVSYNSKTITIAAGSSADNYILTVNGTNYGYTMASGDSATTIASGLASNMASVPDVTVTTTNNQITLTAASGTSFGLSNLSSTVPNNIPVLTDVQLVKPNIATGTSQVFAPGYIEIIDTNNNIIATDDGNGNINNGTVDYISGVVSIPVMPAGDYYIRYLQNSDMNFVCNPNAALTYSLPKQSYSDTVEKFSTITIVS